MTILLINFILRMIFINPLNLEKKIISYTSTYLKIFSLYIA